MFPALVAAQDLDFDPQKKIGTFCPLPREADRIFFRRHNHFQIAANTTIDEL